MNITFSSKQKSILFGAIFFCLGIAVGTFGNLRTHTKLSSQYLGDSGLTCTRECYLTSRGSFTIPGEESCPSEPVCGNGIVEGSETCDDGNMINNDGCSSSCSPDTMMMTTSFCGDGSIQNPNNNGQYEQCDDGNTNNSDGCSDSCQTETMNSAPTSYCGNSMCDGGEDCSSCSSDCGMCSAPSAVCGNGNIEGGELCDDGNMNNNDGCNSTCQNETRCGDGTVQWPAEKNTVYEMCDDGNTNDGDGCNSSCQTETIFYAPPTTNYSYCYDSSACNAWQWVENGTCDYSCQNPTCQTNFHVENGACVSDPITCKEVDGELQLEYSNGSTDFEGRILGLGQANPNISRFEIEYNQTNITFKADMYVDGAQIACPAVILPNEENNPDAPLETCEQILQDLRNEGQETSGIHCTGTYSYTVEKANN